MDSTTARAVLGLPAAFDEAAVRKAFKAAAKRLHPDLGGDRAEFQRAEEARQCLLAHLARRVPPSGSIHEPGPTWKETRAGAVRDLFDLGDAFAQAQTRTEANFSATFEDAFDQWAAEARERDRARATDDFAKTRAKAREARRNSRKAATDLGEWANTVASLRAGGHLIILGMPGGCSASINTDGTVDLFLHAGTDRETRAHIDKAGNVRRTK